jgi:hypothetical protein
MSMAKITLQQKKDLIERVRTLDDPTEHRQLLRVLLKHRINITENSNGCFVDLATINDSIIQKLLNVVELCYKNRDYHTKMSNLLEEARKNVDTLYEKKLDRKRAQKKEEEESESEGSESDDEEIDDEVSEVDEFEIEDNNEFSEEEEN